MANKKKNIKKEEIKVEEITEDVKVEEIVEEIKVEEITDEVKVEEIIEEPKEKNPKKKNTKLNMTFLVIQFFLSIITLALVITFLFNKNILAPLQISLALTLFVTGINNLLIYKRKFFTFLYFLLGLTLTVLAVLTILGV